MHGVLVAHVGAGQIAVALLKTENEAVHLTVGLQLGDLISDPLESGQHVAALHTIVGSHLVGQRGGNDGLAHDGILGHGPLLNTAGANVVQQQNTDFIAGEQLIAAVLALDGNAHTVGVGIGRQHQIRAVLLRQFQTQAQCLEDLGVGVGAGGEIAVRVLLLGDNGDVGDADVLEDTGHRHQTAAVERAVHQLEARGLADAGTDGAGFDGRIQGVPCNRRPRTR